MKSGGGRQTSILNFQAPVPSWPWFGMTSICWLAAHISLQIVWARLICFYARLVQNVMPRYLLGALPMWCRVPSDRQGGKKKGGKKGDWGWLSRCSSWYIKKRRPTERILEGFKSGYDSFWEKLKLNMIINVQKWKINKVLDRQVDLKEKKTVLKMNNCFE